MAIRLPNAFSRKRPRPPKTPDGQMTLFEHLAELRSRLVKACAVIVLGMVVIWFFYDPLFKVFSDPFQHAIQTLDTKRDITAGLNFSAVGSALMLQLKVVAATSLVATSPFWLYQLWAFVMPGLHRNERRWTYIFVGSAAPLFIIGVLVGYYALPKGLAVLVNFTPTGGFNWVNAEGYLTFMIRLLLVFGLAFEIPIVVIVLNAVGVLSSRVMSKVRPFVIFGIFVFAAVATPSTDPFTMLLLALPMTGLYMVSEVIARVAEKRRKARTAALLSDDTDELD